ncbi:MAG: hypothetical protein DRJ26_00685 [Candidatus Methanomethylicota archaeon]|nr:MAG: hypothetical protein DRJ26_00685 [Candidatus Verstraetearchaeota archaeon]
MRGAKFVELSVKSGDVNALNFYLKRGYVVTGLTYNLNAEVCKLKVDSQLAPFKCKSQGNLKGIGKLTPIVWWSRLTWQFDHKLSGEVGSRPLAIYDEKGVLVSYVEYSIDDGELYVEYAAVKDVGDISIIKRLVGALKVEAEGQGLSRVYVSVDASYDDIVREFLSSGFRLFEVEFRAQKNLLS